MMQYFKIFHWTHLFGRVHLFLVFCIMSNLHLTGFLRHHWKFCILLTIDKTCEVEVCFSFCFFILNWFSFLWVGSYVLVVFFRLSLDMPTRALQPNAFVREDIPVARDIFTYLYWRRSSVFSDSRVVTF